MNVKRGVKCKKIETTFKIQNTLLCSSKEVSRELSSKKFYGGLISVKNIDGDLENIKNVYRTILTMMNMYGNVQKWLEVNFVNVDSKLGELISKG